MKIEQSSTEILSASVPLKTLRGKNNDSSITTWLNPFTVVQRPLQDGRRAAASVPDASEREHLDLVQDVLAQTAQLDAVAGVAVHCPEVGRFVRVLLFVHNLRDAGDVKGTVSFCCIYSTVI